MRRLTLNSFAPKKPSLSARIANINKRIDANKLAVILDIWGDEDSSYHDLKALTKDGKMLSATKINKHFREGVTEYSSNTCAEMVEQFIRHVESELN